MPHLCHATGCIVPVPRWRLMCRRHWFMVPKPVRDLLWRTYRGGQCNDLRQSAEYLKAARAAVVAVAAREGRTPDTQLYDLMLSQADA